MWFAALGVVAGTLTTVAGLGGGMLLVLVLSIVWDPRTALAVTAPALLLGNLHRLLLFRGAVDRQTVGLFAVGALPGAFAGGLLAVALPEAVIHWLLLATTALALAREAGHLRVTAGARAMVPGSALAGLVTATSGGGGLLVSPLLLAAGLRAERYVATAAAVSVLIHLARIAAYGLGGLFDAEILARAGLLAASILVGNLVGRAARRMLGERAAHRVTWGTLAVAVTLAVAGVA